MYTDPQTNKHNSIIHWLVDDKPKKIETKTKFRLYFQNLKGGESTQSADSKC